MSRFDEETLEAAAEMLERLAGNTVYQAAWRAGAKRIRALKKLKAEDEVLKDTRKEISFT